MSKEYLLYSRYVSIQAGSLLLNGLDATFNIEKNLKADPNSCELRIYNLSETNRKALQALTNVQVERKAGYAGLVNAKPTPLDTFSADLVSSFGFVAPSADSDFRIFKGDVVQIFSQKEGPDWVTTLRTSDGLNSRQKSRVDPKLATFKKSATIKDIIKKLFDQVLVDTAAAAKKIASGDIDGVDDTILNSYTTFGEVHTEIDKHFKKLNVSGFIEDNQLVILKKGETLGTEAVRLTPDTGLLGSPELSQDGLLKCVSLIRPEIRLGYQLKVESASFNGTYRIERLSYSGSTFDQEWFVTIEATPL